MLKISTKNGDVRLQNPAAPRDRPLKPPSDLIGLPSSLDNTQEMRTLKEENYRLRRSRDAHERELYTTNEELSRAKTRISQLNDSLDNNRTAYRILSGEVAELEKKLRENSKRVGKSKDSASQCILIQSCSSTCRHLRDLKKEVRSFGQIWKKNGKSPAVLGLVPLPPRQIRLTQQDNSTCGHVLAKAGRCNRGVVWVVFRLVGIRLFM